MIDPFDLALSDFIDSLPEGPDDARRLLEEAAPFSGQGDLPGLAELATMLRAVPPPEPRPEWMAAAKARLMAAPIAPPEKRGLTWLGTMFLPLTQLSFPSLPRLSMPAPVLARAVVAAALVVTLGSMATSGSLVRNPLLQVTGQQGPVAEAQQVIAALKQQLEGSDESPHDIVLLSKQLQLADDAIDQAPPAEQARLRSELQSAVRAVRFDGTLEAVINSSSVLIDGVAVQVDPAAVQELHPGEHVSLQVTVTGSGKLQAVKVTPVAPASSGAGPGAAQAAASNTGGPASALTNQAAGASSLASSAGQGAANVDTADSPQTATVPGEDKDAAANAGKDKEAAADVKGRDAGGDADGKAKDKSADPKSLGLLARFVFAPDQGSGTPSSPNAPKNGGPSSVSAVAGASAMASSAGSGSPPANSAGAGSPPANSAGEGRAFAPGQGPSGSTPSRNGDGSRGQPSSHGSNSAENAPSSSATTKTSSSSEGSSGKGSSGANQGKRDSGKADAKSSSARADSGKKK
jgi:hypothetical protein